MKNTLLTIMAVLVAFAASHAQSPITISGTVRDARTGETMIGATVRVSDINTIGTVTNEYGFYSLTLPSGKHTLVFSYTGFEAAELDVKGNAPQDVALRPAGNLKEVVVQASTAKDRLSNPQMGVEQLSIADIKAIPVLFGEKDVLKTLQLLPGVKSAGEGNSGFYVRGGAADQNLVLLDGAPVYNPSHLFGFFSTFNSDAIKDVTLYKGGMPAQFGGRLSSVEDIRMNDGNKKACNVKGGIGLIASRLSVEGPLGSEQGSFLLSGRRTYADAFLKLSSDERYKDNILHFYDLNLKANYRLSAKDHVFLSGYFGKDKLGLKDEFGINWSNATATLRWNHIVSSKLFSNTSAIFSDYNYNIEAHAPEADYLIHSEIRDFNLKQDFSFFASPRSTWRFGLNAIHHTITPGRLTNNTSGIEFALQDRRAWEGAAYVSHSYKAGERLNLEYGVRISDFAAMGAGRYYELDEKHAVKDTLHVAAGEVAKSYVIPEPRLSLSYNLNASSSIKASYARNAQYLHLISNSTAASPTDKWMPSNNVIKPGISDQIAIGYYQNLAEGRYEFSAETYYKALQNQVDYKDGAEVYTQDAIETQLLFGRGRAYGLELLLRKKTGRFTGWLGYTLSRSELQIDGINNGQWYAAHQDRTHDISVVGIYELNDKWTLSGTFVYYTGSAVSFPSGKYDMAGNTVFYYTERNGYRMPPYHRLDLAATKQLAKRKHFSSELSIGLYNAYGRENAYSINFRQNKEHPDRTEAVQTTLFRFIPSITYNFKF
jgi:hypothetical protein